MYELFRKLDTLVRAVRIYQRLARNENASFEEIETYQKEQLLKIVRNAVDHSPFYRKLYSGIQIDEGLRLANLPVTNKRLLMENFDRVVTDDRIKISEIERQLEEQPNQEFYLENYRIVATSGSSGLRGVFVYDRDEWGTILAQTFRIARMISSSPLRELWSKFAWIVADSQIHITSRVVASLSYGTPRCLLLKATQPIEAIRDELDDYQPDILNGHASIVALLAVEQIEGRLTISPRRITCYGEVLGKEKIACIKQAWDRIPHNQYGAAESPMIALDCMQHYGLHQLSDYCITEIVDDDNQPVAQGEAGKKILLTNLHKFVQPIIRYELSDILAWSHTNCPCGRPLPLLSGVQGRAEDLIVMQDANGDPVLVPPILLSACLSEIGAVLEFQVIRLPAGLRFRVVPRQTFAKEEVEQKVLQALYKLLAERGISDPAVEIELVERLDRSTATMGKLKVVH